MESKGNAFDIKGSSREDRGSRCHPPMVGWFELIGNDILVIKL